MEWNSEFINKHTNDQFTFNKGVNTIKWGKEESSTNGAEIIDYTHTE